MRRADFIHQAILSGRFKTHEVERLAIAAEEIEPFDNDELDGEIVELVEAAQVALHAWVVGMTVTGPSLSEAMSELANKLDVVREQYGFDEQDADEPTRGRAVEDDAEEERRVQEGLEELGGEDDG